MSNISFHLNTDSTHPGEEHSQYYASGGDYSSGALLFSTFEGIAVDVDGETIQPIATYVDPNTTSTCTYVPSTNRPVIAHVFDHVNMGTSIKSRSPVRSLWGATNSTSTTLNTAVTDISNGRPDRVWVYIKGYPINNTNQYGNLMMWNVSGCMVNTSGLSSSSVYWISGSLTDVYIQGQINFTGQSCSISYVGLKNNTASGTIGDYSTLMSYLYLWGTFD